MLRSQRWQWLVALAAAVLFVLAVILFPASPREEADVIGGGAGLQQVDSPITNSSNPPMVSQPNPLMASSSNLQRDETQNAFLSPQTPPTTVSPSQSQASPLPPHIPNDEAGLSATTTVSSPPLPLPSLDDLVRFVSSSLSIPTQGSTVLLPAVSDSEIAVDSSGARTLGEYLSYFAAHSSEIAFAGKKFAPALKNEYGTPLLPLELAEKALQDGFSSVSGSVPVWKEYIGARLPFLQTIKVRDEAVAVSKKMVALDKMQLALLQDVSDASAGRISRDALVDSVDKFRAAASSAHSEFVNEVRVVSFGPGDALGVLGKWLGVNTAYAFGNRPFGATIRYIDEYCTCSEPGQLAHMSGPKPPPSGALYVTQAFQASPMFYQRRSFKAGATWLGLYGTTKACLAFHRGDCDFVGMGETVEMAGTT